MATLRKVRDDDPERCNANNSFGQCRNARIDGAQYCELHAGNRAGLRSADLAAKRSYKLQQWKDRVEDFASSSTIKTLREEIGIARMSLEQIIIQCKDGFDVQLNSNKISQLLERIEKLVVACDRLETKMSFTLDKSSAILLADQIINILTDELDPDAIERVAEQIGQVILVAGSQKQLTNG